MNKTIFVILIFALLSCISSALRVPRVQHDADYDEKKYAIKPSCCR